MQSAFWDRNNSVSKPNVEYAVRGPDADGRGEWGDGFTVKAGSKARHEGHLVRRLVLPPERGLRPQTIH